MTKGVLTYLALLLALSATPAPAAQSTSLSVQINVTAQTTVQTATPPTSITQANMLYQLTSDNPAVSVTVGARNVTIDCQGHALANVFVNADNFTLQNCTTSIVQISGANYSTIRNNTIGMMYYWGGYLGYPASTGHQAYGNTFPTLAGDDVVTLNDVSNTSITDNVFTGGASDAFIEGVGTWNGVTISGNTFTSASGCACIAVGMWYDDARGSSIVINATQITNNTIHVAAVAQCYNFSPYGVTGCPTDAQASAAVGWAYPAAGHLTFSGDEIVP